MGRAEASTTATICVELAYSPRAGELRRASLRLPEGTTVAQAIAQCGWALPVDIRVGVWGRLRELTEVLRDRDRIELCRPLKVDPMEARRQRHRSQRAARNG